MISFLKGRIDSASKEAVVIDVNNIGYKVYVARASSYEIGSEIKLLTYDVQKQDESYLVLFLIFIYILFSLIITIVK